jgi:hypothetical protein
MRQSRTRWLSQVLEDKKRRNRQQEIEREDCGEKGETGDLSWNRYKTEESSKQKGVSEEREKRWMGIRRWTRKRKMKESKREKRLGREGKEEEEDNKDDFVMASNIF